MLTGRSHRPRKDSVTSRTQAGTTVEHSFSSALPHRLPPKRSRVRQSTTLSLSQSATSPPPPVVVVTDDDKAVVESALFDLSFDGENLLVQLVHRQHLWHRRDARALRWRILAPPPLSIRQAHQQ